MPEPPPYNIGPKRRLTPQQIAQGSVEQFVLLTSVTDIRRRSRARTPRASLVVVVGTEIAGYERKTVLVDVGRERPLTNLLRNACGIAPIGIARAERMDIAGLRVSS
jgi:hypothetical protein